MAVWRDRRLFRGEAGTAGDGLVGMFLPIWLGGRFNASSTIPVHGAGPWVIVETPPDTTPDDAGDPSRVVFCLDGGPSE
jgi:hypothetical protein